jgi:Tfp pilus assembly protein PilO
MTPLWTRVVADKRAIIAPLAIGLVVNVLAYVLIVRPLGVRSAGAADRATAAATALRAAEKDLALARDLVDGKAAADQELSAFYEKVLPADLVTARRMTYASLPALARKADVRYETRTTALEERKHDERLRRMSIRMVLEGDYKDLCRFIYEVESAPEFIIIDDVSLAESAANEPLTMTINLSTYFRQGADAR